MARLAVFASGTGSNFIAIARAVKGTRHTLEFLLCDIARAPVLARAVELEIPAFPVSYAGERESRWKRKSFATWKDGGWTLSRLPGS